MTNDQLKLGQLKSLLQSKGLWAKKGLGQNFLVDESALDLIVEAADLKPSDNVVEVGPGTGFLTERLVKKAKHVTAVELDENMVRILEDRFRGVENLELINADILHETRATRHEPRSYKVVANIPYYITSPILKHFLQSDNPPSVMVLLVQKEVAEKICGLTGKSLITIETQLFGQPEIIGIVPSKSFYPAPKVESAILKITVFDKPLIPEKGLKDFLRLVKFGFSQKRKKLVNSLGAGLHLKSSEMAEVLREADIDPDLRAEALGIEEWKRLGKVLTKLGK
ncbi:ribosomal RNA small subunit methyltransferase A [Candidatus Peregrinibacteria bacterium]|nr:ribosomal RNA small subunit methyltransferase A [Candidatus Peregrinibacteria bacterium]